MPANGRWNLTRGLKDQYQCVMFISITVFSPVFHIKGHPDTFRNNTSEIIQRHYNKNRTNNAVYLVQSEKYDKLVYIRQTYLGGKKVQNFTSII
jgi:hypothetical protein